MTATRLTVSTPDLRLGDVVLCHGMRVLLDTEPHVWSGTYAAGTGARMIPLGVVARPVYSWPGRVLNVDEVREARIVPMSFLHDDAPQSPFYGRRDIWTVQGNEWARWTVERASA